MSRTQKVIEQGLSFVNDKIHWNFPWHVNHCSETMDHDEMSITMSVLHTSSLASDTTTSPDWPRKYPYATFFACS